MSTNPIALRRRIRILVMLAFVCGTTLPAASAMAQTVLTQRRIPTTPQRYFGTSTASGINSSVPTGPVVLFKQTITSDTIAQRATLTVAAVFRNSLASLTAQQVLRGSFSNASYGLRVTWWSEPLVNPNDPSQGIVFSQYIENVSSPIVAGGRTSSLEDVLFANYNLITPSETGTYQVGYWPVVTGSLPPNAAVNFGVARNPEANSAILAEGTRDHQWGPGGSAPRPFGDASHSYSAINLTINSVPAPGTAALAGTAIGIVAARRRRVRP